VHKLLLFIIALATPAQAQFASYDRLMADLMERYNLPGGAVAVSRNGKRLRRPSRRALPHRQHLQTVHRRGHS